MRVQFCLGNVLDGKIVNQEPVLVPDLALRPGCMVRCKLEKQGEVQTFKVLDGPTLTDEAAVGRIDSWRLLVPVEIVAPPAKGKQTPKT